MWLNQVLVWFFENSTRMKLFMVIWLIVFGCIIMGIQYLLTAYWKRRDKKDREQNGDEFN